MLLDINIPEEAIVNAFNTGLRYCEWATVLDKEVGSIENVSQKLKDTAGACALSYTGHVSLKVIFTGNTYTINRNGIANALKTMLDYDQDYFTSILKGILDIHASTAFIAYCTYIKGK